MVEVKVKLLLAAELFENSSAYIQTIRLFIGNALSTSGIARRLYTYSAQFRSSGFTRCFMTPCLWISRLLGSLG